MKNPRKSSPAGNGSDGDNDDDYDGRGARLFTCVTFVRGHGRGGWGVYQLAQSRAHRVIKLLRRRWPGSELAAATWGGRRTGLTARELRLPAVLESEAAALPVLPRNALAVHLPETRSLQSDQGQLPRPPRSILNS
ncbi:hypothetical protein GUJ93_ZPchr0001g32236 [Zizania palustris]|uniref:Uncharacterized protein n=1 Tax=Zizania palustris TaxID=103762 RepID=A0A8J5RT57_ZIZPA|nr:hypothetical protein GUJ93_ZPchr0001g32236 [Zizania palustris]